MKKNILESLRVMKAGSTNCSNCNNVIGVPEGNKKTKQREMW